MKEYKPMNIHIISVGKVREKYLKLGIAEFQKRLQNYCKLTITELADEQAPENLSDKELIRVKEKEGERILSRIKEGQYVIALYVASMQWLSEELAIEMQAMSVQVKIHLIFSIGRSIGLSDAVLKRENKKLSFSKMTFPYQLMKVILLEQGYRGYKIMSG